MAISSITNYNGSTSTGRSSAAACPTCNGSAARASTVNTFSAYKGRVADSFVCATCGTQKANTSSSASRTSVSSSSAYCPTCGKNSSLANSSLASSPFGNSNTYSCPTCGKGSTGSSASAAGRAAAYTNNTMTWAR